MRTLITLVVLAALAAIAGFFAVQLGVYNVSATDPHLRPTFWVLDTAMRRSVSLRARDIEPPPLGDPAQVARGSALYRAHCVQCHGAPGVAPEAFALGMMPLPASLVHTAREWSTRELYWAIKHGIKMTGMPAWDYRMGDDDLWAVVSFVKRLPQLTPAEYAELDPPQLGDARERESDPARAPDAELGKLALHQYGCPTCHQIPGIVASQSLVGPSLHAFGTRAIIAGRLANNHETLVHWIRQPTKVNPGTAMPDLGVTEHHARDIAAYLHRLR